MSGSARGFTPTMSIYWRAMRRMERRRKVYLADPHDGQAKRLFEMSVRTVNRVAMFL